MSLEKKVSDVKSTLLITETMAKYWYHYFLKSGRGFPTQFPKKDFYVVYTNIDHEIPFQHDASSYWDINFKFLPTVIDLGYKASKEEFDNIMDAYVDIAREGCAAFKEVPTIMPHFTEHSGRALHLAQKSLKPINCCPSLHTGAPFFVYNICAHYFPEREEELSQYVGDMVSTVIQTKLHAIIDIPFGMFLAKNIIEDKLNMDFDDLESFFMQEQKSKDNIPYEHMYDMYREINELAKTIPEPQYGKSKLSGIIKAYFKELGLPQVKREHSNKYFDLKHQVLLPSTELKVGKGMF